MRKSGSGLVTFVPLGLLCLVAGLHLTQVIVNQQTPWKGGGFGMFSTIDAGANRHVEATASTVSHGEVRLEIPNDLRTLTQKLRARPSKALKSELADELRTRQWAVVQAGPNVGHRGRSAVVQPRAFRSTTATAVAVVDVRLVVYRVRYHDGALHRESVGEH